MSNYIFPPSPNYGTTDEPYVKWNNGFTNDELDTFISYCDSQVLEKGTIGGNPDTLTVKTSIRESLISWIDLNPNTELAYERLAHIARQLNGQFYKFDLWGFHEHFQYTIYKSEDSSHYTWHQDLNIGSIGPPRKFTLVMQLSDPSEYEGGDLQLMTSHDPMTVPKEKGLIVAFPSYQVHRVTPVTAGIRKSLVIWVVGPSFK
jgi:PKHD-type hydroxylase